MDLLRPKPLFWVAAVSVGLYLGYVIASSLHAGGMVGLNAFIAGAIAVAILVVLAGAALILALAPNKSGRPAARAAVVGGALLAVGVGLAWQISPIIWPEFRAPVTLEAYGSVNLTLDGLDGYVGSGDTPATCRSEVGGEEVAIVDAIDVATIGPAAVAVQVTVDPDYDSSNLMVWIPPAAEEDPATVVMWQGPEGVVEATQVAGGGQIAFSGIRLTTRDAEGRAPEGWPDELSGTLTWSCEAWNQT